MVWTPPAPFRSPPVTCGYTVTHPFVWYPSTLQTRRGPGNRTVNCTAGLTGSWAHRSNTRSAVACVWSGSGGRLLSHRSAITPRSVSRCSKRWNVTTSRAGLREFSADRSSAPMRRRSVWIQKSSPGSFWSGFQIPRCHSRKLPPPKSRRRLLRAARRF